MQKEEEDNDEEGEELLAAKFNLGWQEEEEEEDEENARVGEFCLGNECFCELTNDFFDHLEVATLVVKEEQVEAVVVVLIVEVDEK